MSKAKHDPAKRRKTGPSRKKPARAGHSAPSSASFVRPDIHREIGYISQRAQAEESRLVTLGKLVLFSTVTRDAWLLDREDSLALCLCKDGQPQPVRVIDSAETFAIEWQAVFAIDGDAFIVQERSGRVVAIHGYPTAEIAAACRG